MIAASVGSREVAQELTSRLDLPDTAPTQSGRLRALPSSACNRGNAQSLGLTRALNELYLLQFAAIHMAELCAGAPKIMRCEVVELQTLGTASNHVPNDVFGDAVSPGGSMTTHCPEHSTSRH
jgi:hypothetical protein